MRGFVRLGGTGHRSGGVPGAIAPQVSISGWARPHTPGQVERGLERLAWLGCGRQSIALTATEATAALAKPRARRCAGPRSWPWTWAATFSTPPHAWTIPTRSSSQAWSSWTGRMSGAKPRRCVMLHVGRAGGIAGFGAEAVAQRFFPAEGVHEPVGRLQHARRQTRQRWLTSTVCNVADSYGLTVKGCRDGCSDIFSAEPGGDPPRRGAGLGAFGNDSWQQSGDDFPRILPLFHGCKFALGDKTAPPRLDHDGAEIGSGIRVCVGQVAQRP